jgi:hypothetical protein
MTQNHRARLLGAAAITAAAIAAGSVWGAQAGFIAAPAQGPAAVAQWSGSLVLRNDGTAPATVVLNFYAVNGSLMKSYTLPNPIPAKGSLTVDTESIPELPNGFLGSAVVSSNQPVSATWLGFDVTNPAVNRTVYNGFADGAATFFVPSVSNGYNDQSSTLAIQNVENSPTTITVRFFERFTGAQTSQFSDSLPPNASHYYDVANLPGGGSLPAPWTGSAVIESASSRVAAAVHQPRLSSGGASVFEGVAAGGTTVYFPSVQLQTGDRAMTSYLSVQNASAAAATVDVLFYNANGSPAGSARASIGPYQKQTFTPASGGAVAGWSGSAVLRATAPVAAVVNTNGIELSTAYAGAVGGSLKGSLPLIRWATAGDPKGLRTSIEVLNTDSTFATDITLRYYDQNGALIQAPSFRAVPPQGKVTHDPGQFVGDGGFTGTVEFEASRAVVGVVTAASVDGTSIETYSSMPIQ